MFDKTSLEIAKSKVKKLYQLTDKQIERADIVFSLECVKPFKSDRLPDSYKVHSLTRSIIYFVNLSNFTCQCEDWKRHNSEGDETKHLCKHLLACILYRHYHVALEEQAKLQPWQFQLDKIAQRISEPMNPQVKQYLNEQGVK